MPVLGDTPVSKLLVEANVKLRESMDFGSGLGAAMFDFEAPSPALPTRGRENLATFPQGGGRIWRPSRKGEGESGELPARRREISQKEKRLRRF
jgi:hypothetical protein